MNREKNPIKKKKLKEMEKGKHRETYGGRF